MIDYAVLNYFRDPSPWLLMVITLIIARRWNFIEDFIKFLIRTIMNYTTGRVASSWSKYKAKRLSYIKLIRYDENEITRLMIRSYTYLILFVIFLMGIMILLGAAGFSTGTLRNQFLYLSIVTFLPTFTLEILWLANTKQVTRALKFKRMLKAQREQRIKSQAPKLVSKHIESAILKEALDRTGYVRNSSNPPHILDSYDFYLNHEIYYDECSGKRSGSVVIFNGHNRGKVFKFKVINTDNLQQICFSMDSGNIYPEVRH